MESSLGVHPQPRLDLTMIVRLLAPGPEGLPIEVYAFTDTTVRAGYEALRPDIFGHLYGVVPEFGLPVLRNPSGHDLPFRSC